LLAARDDFGFNPFIRRAVLVGMRTSDSLRVEIQALTDFLRSNKIEILNVAGPRESKEPGVYEWTLTMLRFSLNRAASGAGSKEAVSEWTVRRGQ
jgi:hypothetical protein